VERAMNAERAVEVEAKAQLAVARQGNEDGALRAPRPSSLHAWHCAVFKSMAFVMISYFLATTCILPRISFIQSFSRTHTVSPFLYPIQS
jgi:hypothetical protein